MNKFLTAACFVSLILLVGCTDSSTATKTLKDMGMTNIQTYGYSWFGCPDDDKFRTKFTAVNPQGHMIQGVVCSDWLGYAHVRFW